MRRYLKISSVVIAAFVRFRRCNSYCYSTKCTPVDRGRLLLFPRAILTGQQAGVPAAIDCLWGRNPSHRQVRTWSTSRDLRWLGVGAQPPKLMMYPQRIQRLS